VGFREKWQAIIVSGSLYPERRFPISLSGLPTRTKPLGGGR
jgi:hypothetical protein